MEGIIIVLTSLLTLAWAGSAPASWSYHGNTGPVNWPTIEAKCGGQKQSPIDIELSKTQYDQALGTLTTNGYDTPPSSMTISNTGKTVKGSVVGSMTLSGGGLAASFKLSQFHLHWGSSASTGSEHTLDQKAYPAEIHFVHYNSQYNSTADALDQPGGLAVLGFFLQGDGSTHAGYQKVLDELPNIRFSGESSVTTPFALTDLLPSDMTKYLRYQGSLTTPTCDETVTWTVFPDPIVLSNAQLTSLRNGLYEETTAVTNPNTTTAFPYTYITDNYRPVQALNGRVVKASYESPPLNSASYCALSLFTLLSASVLTFNLW